MSDREKRYKERYDLELPVTVRWKDSSGFSREAAGTTKNMSPLGAFLICDSRIGEGCAIYLDFDMPVSLGGSMPSRISASGKVVRDAAEVQHSGGYGHAVMFGHLSFERL